MTAIMPGRRATFVPLNHVTLVYRLGHGEPPLYITGTLIVETEGYFILVPARQEREQSYSKYLHAGGRQWARHPQLEVLR